MTKVLIVDDEPVIADYLAISIEDMGFEVSGTALTCAAALESLWSNQPDLALVDTQLQGETCEVVLDECRKLGVPVIVSTGQIELPGYCEGLKVLQKPYADDVLRAALEGWREARS